MRNFFICLMLSMLSLSVYAQDGLAVDKVFKTYGHSRGCKMVVMHNTKLRGYSLAVYKSLTYGAKYSESIDIQLKADRKAAKKIREVVDDGRVASGYKMKAPHPAGTNRYVLFSRTDKGKGAVIYIEGNLSPDDIMKICYSRKYE